MIFLKVFMMAFMATLGFEVALGLCIAFGEIFKGVPKDDEQNSIR